MPTPIADRKKDAPLAWTGLVFALIFCIPMLPLVGAVLGLITLIRRQFHSITVPLIALSLGMGATMLQAVVFTIASVHFEENLQEQILETDEKIAEDHRDNQTSGDVNVSSLEVGDCFDDAAVRDVGPKDTVDSLTVTLVPCQQPHDFEVFAVLSMPDGKFPGEAAFYRESEDCLTRFTGFYGTGLSNTRLEVLYLMPTKQSWELTQDREITCFVHDPTTKTEGSLRNAHR